MKDMIRYAITLALIAAISGGSISAVVGVTSKVVEARKAEELKAALGTLLPSADRFEPMDAEGMIYYQGFTADQPAGYVVTGKGSGYGGTLEVLVGFDANLKITNVQIGSNGETPGIGTKVTQNPDFVTQFIGKSTSDPLSLGKDIQGVSGASMSSDGVTSAVKNAADFINMQASGTDYAALLPDATSFTPKESNGVAYLVGEKEGVEVGYIITGTGTGYNGTIEATVAFKPTGEIQQYQITGHTETKTIADTVLKNTDFAKQFVGKTPKDAYTLGQDIQGVSGASGTSAGIAAAVKDAAKKMGNLLVDPSILELLSEATEFVTKDIGDRSYYEGVKDGALAGYLIVGKGNGYEGPMQVYVAFDNDGLVTGVKILKHSDTPSMVKKVSSDEAFHKQFVGKGISNSFAMGSEIQAVAGATFSSEGVAQAVKEAVTFLHASILK